jgi:hypothetical protein
MLGSHGEDGRGRELRAEVRHFEKRILFCPVLICDGKLGVFARLVVSVVTNHL